MTFPTTRAVLATLLAFGIAACGDDQAARQAEAQKRQAFEATQQVWRAQRVAELTKPDGWTSLVGLHWVDPGDHFVGSDADNGIRLAMGPEHLGKVSLRDGVVRFDAESGVDLTMDGVPLRGTATLRTDADPQGPSVLAFDGGKGLLTAIRRGERIALRVRHADAPSRTGFAGLDYWPGGEEWAVKSRFVPHPPGKTIPVATIIGTIEPMPNPGALEFEREGRTFRIEALDEGEGTLFLVFADRTSGHGSYPAGRYLDVPMPDAAGNVTVDFNQARNPPCAFTAFATCPLPPPENRLDLPVTAGEKAYHFEEKKTS